MIDGSKRKKGDDMDDHVKAAIAVTAFWDAEHRVWSATSKDVEGLHVEAGTYEELLDIVPNLIGELLSLNGGHLSALTEIPLEILAHHQSSVHLNQQ